MTTLPDLDYIHKQQSQQNQELNFSADDYSLLTDLYQLTMAACYTGEGIEQRRGKL